MSKSHGSDPLVLLLDSGKSPLVFLGTGKKEAFSLSPVCLSEEFPGVVAPACPVAVVLSVLRMVSLLLCLFGAPCRSMLLK